MLSITPNRSIKMKAVVATIFVISAVAFSLLFSCSNAYAATITVPTDYATIQEAIDHAVANDSVKVLQGTYTGDIVLKDSVSVAGDICKLIKIVGGVTAASNAVLDNLTIQKDSGTTIDVPSSTSGFQIKNCAIKNLGTDASGVGIFINPLSGNITIKNTIVYVGNHGYDRGIYLDQAGPVAIESNTIHIESLNTSSDTACVYSEGGSTYTLENNILTLNDTSLNAINANTDTPTIAYNCILGKITPITLAHKGTIFAAPSYANELEGDFHLALDPGNSTKSPSVALNSGDPLSECINEIQVFNTAIDLGAYGNTVYTVVCDIPGDLNLDGKVDLLDLGILGDNWSQAGVSYFQGDANLDGKVDLLDLGLIGDNWNSIYIP